MLASNALIGEERAAYAFGRATLCGAGTQVFLAVAPSRLLAGSDCARETGRNACLAHRLGSLCSVRGRTELFQFKLAAVERHHFGNAGNSELARDRSTDKHVQRLVALEIEDYSHFRTLVQFRNGH